MGKSISKVMMAAIALLMLAAASIPAEAQYGSRTRGRGYSKAQVEQIIRRL